MKQKRAEFLKLKALQSYQEAKFKRIKNIKSKRYRKILKKEREKQEEKGLGSLEKDDPIQFKEVMAQIEKQRIKVNTIYLSKSKAVFLEVNLCIVYKIVKFR